MFSSADIEAKLHEQGRRATPQRRAVLTALEKHASHPRIDEIVAATQHELPGIAVSTVYSTVHELAALGVIVEFVEKDGTHLDLNVAPHAHLRCTSCGTIIDIPLEQQVADALEAGVKKVGGVATQYDVIISGLCSSCTQEHVSDINHSSKKGA